MKAHIYRLIDLKNNNSKDDVDIGIGTTATLRLGQMLHVALVIALPINNDKKEGIENINRFPADEILAYDVEIFLDSNSNSQAIRLNDLGLLAGEGAICI